MRQIMHSAGFNRRSETNGINCNSCTYGRYIAHGLGRDQNRKERARGN